MKTMNFEQMEQTQAGGWWSDWGDEAAFGAICGIGPSAALLIPGFGLILGFSIKAGCAIVSTGVIINNAVN